MQHRSFRRAVAAAAIACALVAATANDVAASPAAGSGHHGNPNPVLFGRHAHPYGASMATWGERIARWIYAVPLDHNPATDETGADCAVDQRGPVWFVPPIFGATNGSRTCTIPRHKAIFLDIQEDVQDYPCPDPTYHPAPGQSLYDFLIEQDKPVMDAVNLVDVTLDGAPLRDGLSYRYLSRDLFVLRGDPSMQALDPCVTGRPQPAIVDGFFMMFKPLRPGPHTIGVHVVNSLLGDRTYTYHLTIA